MATDGKVKVSLDISNETLEKLKLLARYHGMTPGRCLEQIKASNDWGKSGDDSKANEGNC